MKIFEGIVVSVKMNNTAVVEITRRTPHPLYGKLIKRSKKYRVDTTGAEITVGQTVKIVETRPISKGKFFKIMDTKKPAAKTVEKAKPEIKADKKAAPAKKVVKTKVARKASK